MKPGYLWGGSTNAIKQWITKTINAINESTKLKLHLNPKETIFLFVSKKRKKFEIFELFFFSTYTNKIIFPMLYKLKHYYLWLIMVKY